MEPLFWYFMVNIDVYLRMERLEDNTNDLKWAIIHFHDTPNVFIC